MNIGITFGGYCPLHQGHLDVIMKSKKENDLTFVVVCGYDEDKRAKESSLPLIKRYRIINNFLTCDLVKVIMVNDTDIGIDESMSDYNWGVWTEAIYKQIHKFIPNYSVIRWYVGEENYKKSLIANSCFMIHNKTLREAFILMDRKENSISGTLCREYPIIFWNKISSPFRAYFSHNILIAGTASEGKTTLTQDIGKYFSIPYSYEKGRDICSLKTDPEFTVKDFIYNIYEQHKYNEDLIASPQNPGVFISDTDNMVTLMYAKAYCERKGFGINKEDYKLLENLADAYTETTTWNKIFLLAPKERGIVDDGERYMPDSDFEIRKQFFEWLKDLYDKRGYKYEILNGDYYQNFIKVRDYIRNYMINGKVKESSQS